MNREVLTREQLAEAMKEMDDDGNGEVEFDEFYDWWLRRLAGGGSTSGVFKAETKGQAGNSKKAALRAAFDMMDTDGDGTLDREEVRQLSDNLGRRLNETELNEIISKMDSDGSGGVDFAKFETHFSA